jgi:glycosyltransferase involved in cell wall biosynthesis
MNKKNGAIDTKKIYKMRILFIVIGNSRRSNYLNGHTIRYGGGGGSGTDTSSIIVAEQLVSFGHEVVFASEKLEPLLESRYAERGDHFNSGSTVRGVKYCNMEFEGVDNLEFDILISSLWFSKYKDLPVTVKKSIIYWCHMQWIYGVDELINYAKDNNLSLGIVNISEWEKKMTSNVISSMRNSFPSLKTTLIPNPIMDDIITEVISNNPIRKRHKFIFHAAWARGGNIAVEAVRQLPYEDKEFHAFDYLLATHAHGDSFFNLHNGVDKKTLFTHLAESEYFIYPLYTPYKDVHKDTFSCVVAEAIALGVIPITYKLGALPENFDGYCQWLDFPAGVDPYKMQEEPLSKDEDGKFTITDNILRKVYYLENNPEIKNNFRNSCTQDMLSKFSSGVIGEKWVNFLNELL